MSLSDLLGKYLRLRRELVEASAARHWRNGLIDRLTTEISETERTMAHTQPVDEQTNDALPVL